MTGETLFSNTRIRALHRRALELRDERSGFLAAHAGAEIASRLMVTNRRFERVLLLDAFPADLQAALADSLGEADIECRDLLLQEDDLQLAPASRGLIVAGLALHRRNDLPGTLTQIRRALVPDGLFMGVLPGENSLKELRESLLDAEAQLTDSAAARIDPFVEIRQAGSLLQRAGFALPVTDVETLDLRYGDITGLIRDLRANAASYASGQDSRPLQRWVFEAARTHYLANFSDEEGQLRATLNLIYLTGWAPHEGQQQPLRPGSAKNRLADFLAPGEKS